MIIREAQLSNLERVLAAVHVTQMVALLSAFLLKLPMAGLMAAFTNWPVIVCISRFLSQTHLVASLRLAHL